MRIAIVTGGSKGLGLALCEQLRAAGYHVVEYSRSAPHPYSVALDLTDPTDVDAAVATSLASVDAARCTELLLFSNAGTLAPIGPAWRKPASDVLANVAINLASGIAVINAVVRHFRGAPCRKLIVNISSGAALKGYAGWSLYCAGKAGMEGFIRALAVEESAQAHPFLPVSVDPGVIDTAMQALIRETAPADFPEVARFISRKHSGGLAAPEDVAAAILQLVADPSLQPGGRYEAMG